MTFDLTQLLFLAGQADSLLKPWYRVYKYFYSILLYYIVKLVVFIVLIIFFNYDVLSEDSGFANRHFDGRPYVTYSILLYQLICYI